MIKEQILQAIEICEVLEIEYCNLYNESCIHYIREFRIVKEKETEYVEGYYFYGVKSYRYRIDRIKSVRVIWTKIQNSEAVAAKSGLYLFVCEGDMHRFFELHRLQRGEKLCKYFQDDYAHSSGWVTAMPTIFHFIGFYPDESSWSPYDSKREKDENEVEIVAYINSENEYDYSLKLSEDYQQSLSIVASHRCTYRL